MHYTQILEGDLEDLPLDLTSTDPSFESIDLNPIIHPISIQTDAWCHLQKCYKYLMLWSNGSRSWNYYWECPDDLLEEYLESDRFKSDVALPWILRWSPEEYTPGVSPLLPIVLDDEPFVE
jgi:hypothetical protein